MESDRQFFSYGLFFALLPPPPPPPPPLNNPRNQTFDKMKKTLGDIIILQMCTTNENHRCMIPEIWSETDRIFSHFGPFFTLLPS